MKYGVQLYSLREIGEKDGLEAILKIVSEAGYEGVEFAGFYGESPENVKRLLEKYNLKAVSAHISAGEVEKNLPYVKTLGLKYVFTAGIWGDAWEDENYPNTVAEHKKALKILNDIGVEFGYHNHSHEFANGQDLIKKITDDVPGMRVELDLCWATYGGRNVVETMKEYGDKMLCIHIKELSKDAKGNAPIVGEGAVDMYGAFKTANEQNLEWGILEVEGYGMPEIDYLKKSLENIKKIDNGEQI